MPDSSSAETRVSGLARRLLSADASEIAGALEEGIEAAVGLAGADRGVIVAYGDSTAETPEILAAFDYPESERAWISASPSSARLQRNETLRIDVISASPAEAASMRERGVEAFLTVPITTETRVLGLLLLECTRGTRSWDAACTQSLEALAEILGYTIERVRTEQALRESETRFRALTEHATELIAEIDETGNYLYVSPSAHTLLGYEPEELLGTNSVLVVHPDDLRTAAGSFLKAVEEEAESHASYRVRHKDGSWRWFDNTGRVFRTPSGALRFVSVARDITARRQVDDAFAESLAVEAHLAALSRRFLDVGEEAEVDDAIRRAIADTGVLVGADRGYYISYLGDPAPIFEWRTQGMEKSDYEQLPWASSKLLAGQVLHLSSLDDVPPEAADERARYAQRGVVSLVGVPLHSNQHLVGYLSFERTQETRAFSEEEISALGVIGQIFVSALRRQQAEVELELSHIQLAQAQKIEAVGRLAGGIAHDFNNLLTVILGFARPLLEDVHEEARGDVEQICGAAQRAATLTGQLLAFSRRQSLSTHAVDLKRVVAGLEEMLRRLLEVDVELVFSEDDEPCVVEGDASQFEQLLMNLALNARDAMPDGGQLHVHVSRAQLTWRQRRQLGLKADRTYAVLEVRDSGCGMEAEVRAQLFEPFFTTKEQGKGTGLGLSIAYGVVQQAGGVIEVQSEQSKGSTFSVYLPCIDSDETAQVEMSRKTELGGTETILLAEDEPAVRSLVRRLLERAGYVVVEAADGEAALERVAAGAAVDVLVTDVVMPRMGGVELARQLRDAKPLLPVLYLSGYPDEQCERRGEKPPSGVFLRKPFDRHQLLVHLRALLDD